MSDSAENITEISEDEQIIRDENLDILLNSERTLGLLLQILEVCEEDDALFLDGIKSTFYGGSLTREQYHVLKKYIIDDSFVNKCRNFIQMSSTGKVGKSFSGEEISNLEIDFKVHLETILQKFQIFDHLGDKDLLRENYRAIAKSENLGTIFSTTEGDNIYLVADGCIFTCKEFCLNNEGLLHFFIFIVPEGVVIFDYITNEFFLVEGKYRGIFESNGYNWINTCTNTKETITILETRDRIEVIKYVGIDNPEITRFQDIYPNSINDLDPFIVLFGIQYEIYDTRKDRNDQGDLRIGSGGNQGELKIRKKFYEKVINVSGEEIFFCNGTIKDIISTKDDTLILYEGEYYNQDDYKGNFTSKYTRIFSCKEQRDIIQSFNDNDMIDVITDNNSCVIVVKINGQESIFNIKDGVVCMEAYKVIITQDNEHSMISFYDGGGKQHFYSTLYSRMKSIIDPSTGNIIGMNIVNRTN